MTVLYDSDCGFCRWSLSKVLAWDRRRALMPIPLQDPRSDSLLGDMGAERKMGSWHLVTREGEVRSGGAALPGLLRELPGAGAVAALATRAPRLSERGYRLIAGNRSALGRLVTAGAKRRADRRIASRS